MVETLKFKRAIFPKGKQRALILKAKKDLLLTWNQLSDLVGTCTRNLTDWKNERFSIKLNALEIICKKLQIDMPAEVIIKDPYWHINDSAKKGGLKTFEKYKKIGGDEKNRKNKWREWWDKEGIYKKQSILTPISVKKPKFSIMLAEFVGVMLGDGGMNNYQLKITLNCIDDWEYSIFLEKIIEKLFALKPKNIQEKVVRLLI